MNVVVCVIESESKLHSFSIMKCERQVKESKSLQTKTYLGGLVHLPVIKALGDLPEETIILHIIEVQGHGGERHPLVNGLDFQPIRHLIPRPT